MTEIETNKGRESPRLSEAYRGLFSDSLKVWPGCWPFLLYRSTHEAWLHESPSLAVVCFVPVSGTGDPRMFPKTPPFLNNALRSAQLDAKLQIAGNQ